MFRDEFPALWHFFGAYLHQDWSDEYTSTHEAFRDFLADKPTAAAQVSAELTTVLDSGRNEEQLERLVDEGGSFYLPSSDGMATAAWLSGLLELCSNS